MFDYSIGSSCQAGALVPRYLSVYLSHFPHLSQKKKKKYQHFKSGMLNVHCDKNKNKKQKRYRPRRDSNPQSLPYVRTGKQRLTIRPLL